MKSTGTIGIEVGVEFDVDFDEIFLDRVKW